MSIPWGQRFLVRTDHYSLKFLLDQCLATIPQHHWVDKLLAFDFSVEYKAGSTNTVADALSLPSLDLILTSSITSDKPLIRTQ